MSEQTQELQSEVTTIMRLQRTRWVPFTARGELGAEGRRAGPVRHARECCLGLTATQGCGMVLPRRTCGCGGSAAVPCPFSQLQDVVDLLGYRDQPCLNMARLAVALRGQLSSGG